MVIMNVEARVASSSGILGYRVYHLGRVSSRWQFAIDWTLIWVLA